METKDVVILEVRLEESGAAGKKVPDAKKEVDALATSIIGLQQANKRYREERNKVDTATEQGIKRIKELNELIDKNTDIIKENSSSLEKQKMNVGNYQRGITDALKEIRIGGVNVGEIVDKLSKANEDLFQGMIKGYRESGVAAKLFGTTARTALTLTGIGLVLAGLLTMIAYWEDIKEAIGLADSESEKYFQKQQENLEKSRALLDSYNKVLMVQNELLSIQGEKEAEIFANKRKSLLLEIQLAEKQQEALKARIEGYIAENNLTAENLKLRAQSAKAFGLKDPFVTRLNELRTEFNKASQSAVDLKNQLAILDAQEGKSNEERAKKEAEEREKRLQKEIDDFAKAAHEKYLRELEEQERLNQALQELRGLDGLDKEDSLNEQLQRLAESHRTEFLATQEHYDELTALYVNASRERMAQNEKEKDDEERNRRERLRGVEASIAAGVEFGRAAFGKMKEVAIAESIINTVLGVVRALKDYAWPYNLIVGALVGAAGAVQTAKIANTKYARGGEITRKWPTIVGGRPHSQGGTTYRGEDGNVVEVEQGEGLYVMKKSAQDEINRLSGINQKHGGVPWTSYPGMTPRYALGGEIVARQGQQAVDQNSLERAFRNAFESFPPVFVTVEQFDAVANEKYGSENRANVTPR